MITMKVYDELRNGLNTLKNLLNEVLYIFVTQFFALVLFSDFHIRCHDIILKCFWKGSYSDRNRLKWISKLFVLIFGNFWTYAQEQTLKIKLWDQLRYTTSIGLIGHIRCVSFGCARLTDDIFLQLFIRVL